MLNELRDTYYNAESAFWENQGMLSSAVFDDAQAKVQEDDMTAVRKIWNDGREEDKDDQELAGKLTARNAK